MQHLFRLSQKFKPETPVSLYAPVLCAALDRYLDLPRVPSISSFGGQVEQRLADGSLANSSEAFLQFIAELLGPSTNAWEELNARRLELEALRPDHRLSTVHEEAVKLLRGDIRLRNLQSEVLIKSIEGNWTRSARKEDDVEVWSSVVTRVEGKLKKALKALERGHHALFLMLELSPQIADWAGLPNTSEAAASSLVATAASRQADERADREWLTISESSENPVTPQQLAAYMKALHFGGSADELSRHRDARTLYEHLEMLAHQPESWKSLSDKAIQWLAFEQILQFAFSGSGRQSLPSDLYPLAVVQRLDVKARRSLEESVATVLDGDARQVSALMPFMARDPDPGIVSTASLDIATLIPLENGDPMTGPKFCIQLALQEALESKQNPMQEIRAASILNGVLLLGDRRVLPLLDGCWEAFGPEGQGWLCEARSGHIFASMAEFYLRWLEAVDEDDFRFPAGALGRLAEGTILSPPVRDVERRFPAPFNLPDEEYERNPAVKELHRWTIPEFARVIEPRLRQLYLR